MGSVIGVHEMKRLSTALLAIKKGPGTDEQKSEQALAAARAEGVTNMPGDVLAVTRYVNQTLRQTP